MPADAEPTSAPASWAAGGVYDAKLVEDFLSGEFCLHGGSGWWKYELCYGKRAEQYHEVTFLTDIFSSTAPRCCFHPSVVFS